MNPFVIYCSVIKNVHYIKYIFDQGLVDDMKIRGLFILGCWSYALFWAVMPFAGFGKYEVEPNHVICALAWMLDTRTNMVRFWVQIILKNLYNVNYNVQHFSHVCIFTLFENTTINSNDSISTQIEKVFGSLLAI